MTIHYSVSLTHALSHLYTVELSIPTHSQSTLMLSLPAWIPGSYMIRDFAKNITQITAASSVQEIALNPVDKQTWQLNTQGSAVTIRYQVYAFDTSVRTAFLDANRGFFNGTSLFLQVHGFEQNKQQLTIIEPNNADTNLKVATGLKREDGTNLFGFGRYYADNYAELIDCPVEISDFDCIEFSAGNTPHYVILTGKHYADKARIQTDLAKLCQHHIDLFEKETGGKPPFSEYWFLTNILPNSFGGLEHKNSTALLCANFDFPNKNKPDETNENYQTFLSLASHEYFHSWNVCRIKPAEFMPYQTQTESYTSQLWAYEGITSYYDDLSLYRTGIIDFKRYLAIISKTYTRVYRGKGEQKQSVSDSSFYSWTKFYKQAEDAPNNITSYYTKGCLIAIWLDLTIRKSTQNTKSLDDFMRSLWVNFGKINKGTTEHDFITLLNQLTQQDYTDTFKHILHTAEHFDLTELLTEFGIEMQIKSANITNTLVAETNPHTPYFGAIYRKHAMGLEILSVLEDSPAEQAGINPKDILIAIDNLQLNDLADFILQHQPLNTEIKCHLFRDSQLIETKINLKSDIKRLVELTEKNSTLAKLWQQVI